MRSSISLLLLIFSLSSGRLHAQDLHKVSPIMLRDGDLPISLSFVLTTLDDNFYQHKPLRYQSSIQIIDADAPWPPRWYALNTPARVRTITPSVMLNASYENGRFLYFTVARSPANRTTLAVLSCDRSMMPVDTFFAYPKSIDAHDFASSPSGELMYFALHDTVVDLRKVYGNPLEAAANLTFQSIEIADSAGRPVFSWNPFTALGVGAIYLPYRYSRGIRADQAKFDWSHGNSVHYDYDGNILYSLKHVGIGKISRADGHIIWRIDRNRQQVNAASDLIPIYLQHDLQVVRDTAGHISYTVWSNGDSLHPFCRGYQFTVQTDGAEPVVRLLRTITPSLPIPHTGGGGNMDVDAYGSYLLNYGMFTQDSTLPVRPLFEYSDQRSHRSAHYSTYPTIFTFRTHVMSGWRPPRPAVREAAGQLTQDTRGHALRWYRLSGPGLATVEYLGSGQYYKPAAPGYYCVASQYGIGWSVSRPFYYTR